MPNWVPAVVAAVALVVSVILQFYFKWVPDVKDQKRHLKQAGWWVLDVLTFGCQGFALYSLGRSQTPVTPAFVVDVALVAGMSIFYLTLFFLRRLVLRLINQTADRVGRIAEGLFGSLEIHREHFDVTRIHAVALAALADDPNLPRDTAENLRSTLNLEKMTEPVKKLLGSKEPPRS